jgi:hypothetical protein
MMATEPQRHITVGSPLSNETTATRLGLPYASDRSVQKRKLACRTLYIDPKFMVKFNKTSIESCKLLEAHGESAKQGFRSGIK